MYGVTSEEFQELDPSFPGFISKADLKVVSTGPRMTNDDDQDAGKEIGCQRSREASQL